jgi:hypothetical protein
VNDTTSGAIHSVARARKICRNHKKYFSHKDTKALNDDSVCLRDFVARFYKKSFKIICISLNLEIHNESLSLRL